jgi:dephospho-CoA kinase
MTFQMLDRWAEKRDPNAPPLEPVFLIGLTGPIGCGKTTVGKMLGHLGARIVDADQVSRAVMAPDQPVLDQIQARFGRGVMTQEGAVDRSALANLVFHDPVALRDLEAMTHPLIRLRIDQGLELAAHDGVPFAVLEAIKLIENEELASRCDEIWLIDCAPAIQRERAIDRGLGGEDLDQRMIVQNGIRERAREKADRIIDTGVPLDQLRTTVEEALASALADKLDILPIRWARKPEPPAGS